MAGQVAASVCGDDFAGLGPAMAAHEARAAADGVYCQEPTTELPSRCGSKESATRESARPTSPATDARIAKLEAALADERRRSNQKDERLATLQRVMSNLEVTVEQRGKVAQLEAALSEHACRLGRATRSTQTEALAPGEETLLEKMTLRLTELEAALRQAQEENAQASEQAMARSITENSLTRSLTSQGLDLDLAAKDVVLEELQIDLESAKSDLDIAKSDLDSANRRRSDDEERIRALQEQRKEDGERVQKLEEHVRDLKDALAAGAEEALAAMVRVACGGGAAGEEKALASLDGAEKALKLLDGDIDSEPDAECTTEDTSNETDTNAADHTDGPSWRRRVSSVDSSGGTGNPELLKLRSSLQDALQGESIQPLFTALQQQLAEEKAVREAAEKAGSEASTQLQESRLKLAEELAQRIAAQGALMEKDMELRELREKLINTARQVSGQDQLGGPFQPEAAGGGQSASDRSMEQPTADSAEHHIPRLSIAAARTMSLPPRSPKGQTTASLPPSPVRTDGGGRGVREFPVGSLSPMSELHTSLTDFRQAVQATQTMSNRLSEHRQEVESEFAYFRSHPRATMPPAWGHGVARGGGSPRMVSAELPRCPGSPQAVMVRVAASPPLAQSPIAQWKALRGSIGGAGSGQGAAAAQVAAAAAAHSARAAMYRPGPPLLRSHNLKEQGLDINTLDPELVRRLGLAGRTFA